jgi:hypothetical protein
MNNKMKRFLRSSIELAVIISATQLLGPTVGLGLLLADTAFTIGTTNYFKKRADNKLFPVSQGVPLTTGETSLTKSIFGKRIRLGKVKKYFSAKKNETIKVTPNGTSTSTVLARVFDRKTVKFYGNDNRSADYSQTKNPEQYITFAHEMTHVWQKQPLRKLLSLVNVFNPLSRPNKRYDYRLTQKSRFRKFGPEQQATIIGDYAYQFLYAGYQPQVPGKDIYMPSLTPIYSDETPEETAKKFLPRELLRKVVEDKFPEARRTRETLERQRTAAAPAP